MPLRVLIVPDKFKGSLDAARAADAIEAGLRRVLPDVRCTKLPITDGGEGFVELLGGSGGGEIKRCWTINPMGRRCRARVGWLPGRTGVVGLTEASGIWRIAPENREAGRMSTEGTGRLMGRLMREGAKRVVVGLGGSCSNDGGIGLAAACGYRFLDKDGDSIPLNGFGLEALERIEPPPTLPQVQVIAATDVDNPLYGEQGAAAVFAPQKGADKDAVRRLDRNLRRLATVCERDLGRSAHDAPGAGAAGGCGYGLMTFFHAERVSGFELFADLAALEKQMARHDLVVTGEGSLDDSSMGGKGPVAVGAMARKLHRPVWAVCGICQGTVVRSGFDGVGEIMSLAKHEADGMRRAAFYLRRATEQLAGVQWGCAR